MRAVALVVLLPALLSALLLVCCGPLVFSCDDARQCTREGRSGGSCVRAAASASRYCAFSDPQCPSGLRFDATAGEGLGSQCVGAAISDAGAGDLLGGDDGAARDMAGSHPGILTFTPLASPGMGNLWCVGGYDDAHLWAGGPDGIFFSGNGGTSWTKQPLPGGAGDITGIYATGGRVWAVNHQTQIFFSANDGANWVAQPVPMGYSGRLYAIWGSGPSNVFVIGDTSTLLHTMNGLTWVRQVVAGDNISFLNAVWGSSPTDVWVTGGSGVAGVRSPIGHTTNGGGSWIGGSLPSDLTLFSLWGSSAADIYAVGEQQVIYHASGGAFSQLRKPTGNSSDAFSGVWGPGADLVLVVGTGGLAIVSIDGGKTWIDQPTATGADLNAVWGARRDSAYVVGQGGAVLHVTP